MILQFIVLDIPVGTFERVVSICKVIYIYI